jgi:thiol-disulfide isomerase/thioredoxin
MTDPADPSERPPGEGLAVGSLVLGILAVALSPAVVGGLLAVLGLALGLAHLTAGRAHRRMARWGAVLSAVGLVVSLGAGLSYYRFFKTHMAGAPDRRARADRLSAWTGREAPALTLRTIDGEPVDTAALKGRPVLVDRWATWCEPCRRQIPHLNRLAEEAGSGGLVVIAVSDEDADTLREFRHGTPMSYAVVSADDLPEPFGRVPGYPTTFFVGADGRFRSAVTGYTSFEGLRRMALADSPPSP